MKTVGGLRKLRHRGGARGRVALPLRRGGLQPGPDPQPAGRGRVTDHARTGRGSAAAHADPLIPSPTASPSPIHEANFSSLLVRALPRITLAGVLLCMPMPCVAQSMTATWNTSPASHGATVPMCVGTRSLACDTVRWTVNRLQQWFTFTPVRGVLHLVTVRAVGPAGAGPYAQEIGVSTPRLTAIADRSNPSAAPVAVALTITNPDGSGATFTATSLPPA